MRAFGVESRGQGGKFFSPSASRFKGTALGTKPVLTLDEVTCF